MSKQIYLNGLSVYLAPKEEKFIKKKSRMCLRTSSDYIRLLIEQDMKNDKK
ncbi:MAG: hypothetical protein QQN41_06020 [Nitrosopumilus sp.]